MASAAAYRHPSIDLQAWQAADQDARVLLVDGDSIKLVTRAAHLSVSDGPPRQHRERRIARQPRKHSRMMVLAGHGYLSVEALRWLHGSGIPWTMIDPYNHDVIGMSSPAREDAQLLRLQCAAKENEAGLDVAKHLMSTKIAGQADNVRDLFHDEDAAKNIRKRIEDVNSAESIGTVMAAEGQAAAAYWAVWNRVAVPWTPADRKLVPEHWLKFDQRASLAHIENGAAIGPSVNKDASNPINAVLNYLYAIAENQAVIACRSVGLSPVVGICHTDRLGRASMALDLLETARPLCDRIALSLLMIDGEIRERFDRRWISEGVTGVVRIMPPFTHRLSAHAAELARAIQPHAESAVKLLTGRSAPRRVIRSEAKEHRSYPRCHLKPGTRTIDLLPDSVWQKIQPILPALSVRGRPPKINQRDYLAALVARFVLAVPWDEVPGRPNRQTMIDRLRVYQRSGAWDKVVQLVNESGHLASLAV